MNTRKKRMCTRYRFGFFVGSLSLSMVFFLWMTSRSNEPLFQFPEPMIQASLVSQSGLESVYEDIITKGHFHRGKALYNVLSEASLTPPQIVDISKSLKKIINPRTLKSSDYFELLQAPDGTFQELKIVRGLKQFIVKTSTELKEGAAPRSILSVLTEKVPLTKQEKKYAGEIKDSLWMSMRQQGLSPQLIMNFSDIFAWNIDFLTEPRNGDTFSVVVEEQTTPKGKVSDQKILAALYKGRQTGEQTAIYFEKDYYQPNGKSLRKAFLRAPLNFRRISSGFSRKRFHPILRIYRPHLGIDYAAPTGTPVVSLGEGKVIFKGWKGGYGRFIKVRHNRTYTTCYGHLSRYAKKLKVGQKVKQGQVIGYVGSSGLSTGPHLDFRVIKNKKFVNFLKLRLPSDKRINKAKKQSFQEIKTCRMRQLKETSKGPMVLAKASR